MSQLTGLQDRDEMTEQEVGSSPPPDYASRGAAADGGGGGEEVHGEGLREPPSSQVGYGGGDDRYYKSQDLGQLGSWKEKEQGENDEQSSRYAVDREGDSDSGSKSSLPGSPRSVGYPAGGAYGDESSKSSGTYGKWDGDGSSAGYGSEVRNGVPHRMRSDGLASGAGITDGLGAPTSDDVDHLKYHQTEGAALPSSDKKETAYSQLLTSDGPNGSAEGKHVRFHEDEGLAGITQGGPAVKVEEDHPESEGFLQRMMHKLPGHSHKEESGTDSNSDMQGVDSSILVPEDEEQKHGVVNALKDKVMPHHEKHYDEDTKIFE